MLLPISPPPGVVKEGTEYAVGGSFGEAGFQQPRWWNSSLVRDYDQAPGPVGGWRTRPTSGASITGLCRALMPWRASPTSRWIAFGTHLGLFVKVPSGTTTDITPSAFTAGEPDETAAVGFGTGTYGSGPYGTPRPDTGQTIPALVWDLDVWGTYLVALAFSDGRLVEWDLNTGNDAAVITNAPTSCLAMLVTQDGFLMAGGASGDPRAVAWSGQGDNTVWTPAADNQAGDFTLRTSGVIRKMVRVGRTVLILTDIDAHTASYIGLPDVYRFDRIAAGCGVVSKGALATTGDFAAWISPSGVWRFDGAVSPIPCPLWDFFISNLNQGQQSKVTGWHNSQHRELWWHYPSTDGVENDRYIAWRYADPNPSTAWRMGEMSRLCGIEAGVFKFPMCVDADANVYEHEVGTSYDVGGSPAEIFTETAPFQLGIGDRAMECRRVIFDESVNGVTSLVFKTRPAPNGAETVLATETPGADGFAYPRFEAMQAKIRIIFDPDSTARSGKLRLDLQPGGDR